MKISAYAKINLTLRVLGRREDGFHELETRMQAVKLHDDVDVEWKKGCEDFRIVLKTNILNGQDVTLADDDSNIAYRAAALVQRKLKPTIAGKLTINIDKYIPVAAGLAGGSTDGAAVLTALKELWQLSSDDLLPIASELGSDVPFCFMAQNGHTAAIGRGRGTELEFVEPENYSVILSNPGFGVSTPAVYKAWDDNPVNETGTFYNDLQEPALSLRPEIRKTIDYLESLEPIRVQLSGSGPTVFALFRPGTVPDLSGSPNRITISTTTI